MTKFFYADVDMILEAPRETRNASGATSVQGEVRDDLTNRGLRSKILELDGPAGGNPLVRIIGPRIAIESFLTTHGYDGVKIMTGRYAPRDRS